MSGPVLEIANLSVAIKGGGDRPHAVRGINLTVGANEIVCVVGESGSGKSVTAQAVMGLLPKNAMQVETGWIRLEGEELTALLIADEPPALPWGSSTPICFATPRALS
jgi:peptide/nickel transport system ATP-binding protein